jgi:hypothetical protein
LAVVPLTIWALAAVVFFVLVRYVAGLAGWVARRSVTLSRTVDATRAGLRGTWLGMWRRLDPSVVADLYFVGAVVTGVLVLFPYRGILAGMATSDTAALGNLLLRRSYPIVLSLTILMMAVSWRSVFRYVGRRGSLGGRVPVARWGSLAWILALLILAAMPWQLLQDLEGERVLLDGRPAYLLVETPTELLLYDPEAGTTLARPTEPEPELQRFDTRGYPFEGLESFREHAEWN